MKDIKKVFEEFLSSKGLKESSQRFKILEIFLKTEKHLSADDLYRLVREKYPEIGFTTVYRTLKLFCDSELAREVDFGDGRQRYEHNFGHEHHDHLVCLKCGSFFEVVDARIEKLQENLAKKEDFIPIKHKMDIFGICKKCRKK